VIPAKSGLRLVRAASLGELYRKSGWSTEDDTSGDHRLADFVFGNLRGSNYTAAGYGSIDDVLAGDIAMVRRLEHIPGSDVHLYAALDPTGMRAFMLWYSLEAGGPGLIPPEHRRQQTLPGISVLRDVAYGDWLIVDASHRVRGLGGVLFAIMLRDMAKAGYRRWYGRTVVPENLGLYEHLYHRKGRANLISKWQDGALTRIGFMGNLEGGWTEDLLRISLQGKPDLSSLI